MTDEIKTDPVLRDIAAVFRCHPSMAVAIADRIRERLGRAVSNADIVRVMKTIPPTRLSVDTVIAKLEKQPQRKGRAKTAPDEPPPARAGRAKKDKVPAEKTTLQEQLAALLAANWKRAASEKLTAPNMSVSDFVKAVRNYTGHKDAPLRRILNAAAALDREQVLLTAHVVADRVNELALHGDEEE